MSTPTVVLVHGAFAESASWNGVIKRLHEKSVLSVAVANPLRSLSGDAAYLRDVIASIEGPVILAAHSYGGLVISEAGAGNPAVQGLVYVSAFAGDRGENAFDLSTKFPGSTLGEALAGYPVASGGNELYIRQDRFHQQFCADVPADEAALMAATQRPVTEKALTDPLPTDAPGWRTTPSWFVISDQDLNLPVAAHRYFAERAGARVTREIEGGSHALSVSQPGPVAEVILEAVKAVSH